MSKKYLEGTKIEDLRGMKFGKLTVVWFDYDRYEKDKTRIANGKINNHVKYWICKCDCGKIKSVTGGNLKSLKQSSCGLCYTFEDWCLDNNHQDYLDLWDYELNNCKPSEIGFGTHNKYYFKCTRGVHESELWQISSLTSKQCNGNQNSSVSCRKCNSIGQYLLDIYDNLDMWSDKNTVDPFEILRCSRKKYYIKCNICGEIKYISLNSFIRRGVVCNKCGDGFSIPAKTFKAVLDQLGIEHKMELTKLDFIWIGNYRYDFYIPSLDLIVEIHGGQHYKNRTRWRTLEEEQENDRQKKELALKNGFNYCVIDCRYSELEWLKNNTIKEFSTYVNLDGIDWAKAYEYAQKTIVKEICDYWNNREDGETTGVLAKIFGVNYGTIRRYLKRGTDIGWCKYDATTEFSRNSSSNGKNNTKEVEIFKDGISLGVFESIRELEVRSEELFGVKLYNSSISSVCLGKQKHHMGYTFRHIYKQL